MMLTLPGVTESQQEILREVYQTSDLHDIPQLWAMYKEVMGYYARADSLPQLKCPDDGKFVHATHKTVLIELQ
jgi:hypothetical protein